MPAIIGVALKWFGSSLLLPLFQWLIQSVIIPFFKATVIKTIEYYTMKKKLKDIEQSASAKVDEYDKNPNSDNFANLP